MDQHVDRPASREYGVRDAAHIRDVPHVWAEELRRPAGSADRLDRRRAPCLVVPDDEDLRPAPSELDRPHRARRPREEDRLSLH
jgi:hypothetical protein